MTEYIEDTQTDDGWEWAIVEVFGHRRHAGRTREEERFGAKMLRIDVPTVDTIETTDASQIVIDRVNGWTTHFYSGSAIFSFTLTDEATAVRANRTYRPPARYLTASDDLADESDEGLV